MKDLNIHLSIDSILIQGVEGDLEQIREAVQQELSALLMQCPPELLKQLHHRPTLQIPNLKLTSGATSDEIAVQVAQQIYATLTGT